MTTLPRLTAIIPFDDRRQIALPGSFSETIVFCVEQFLHIANEAIEDHGYFAVALSGGSTPKAIFQALAKQENRYRTDWSRFLVFWSDERSVAPLEEESNFHMAMEAGWKDIPVPKQNIFRMRAEENIAVHAEEYEQLILTKIPSQTFDLTMLGMGDDGHTASLFPYTEGLHIEGKLVIANYIPQKNTWRMSLTFSSINASRHAILYVLGAGKEGTVKKVLTGPYQPDEYPSQRVGTCVHKALWVLDNHAASLMGRA